MVLAAKLPACCHSFAFQDQKLEVKIIKTIKIGQAMVGAKSPPIKLEASLKKIKDPQKPIPITMVNSKYFQPELVSKLEKLLFLKLSAKKYSTYGTQAAEKIITQAMMLAGN